VAPKGENRRTSPTRIRRPEGEQGQRVIARSDESRTTKPERKRRDVIMAKDEYTQKLELVLGRLLYASRLVMDIVDEEGLGSDPYTSEKAVHEMQIARRNAQGILKEAD